VAETVIAHKLTGIEACRGVAASLVVLYHAARHLDKVHGVPSLMQVFQFGHAGVDLFFVLSGFIILFVHHDDVGRPQTFARYAERRLTRIFPTYWVALALTICLGAIGGRSWPPLIDVVWSAALLPSHVDPLLGLAWTLQFEIVFYVAFCLLILNRSVGLCAFALWLVWIAFPDGTSGTISNSLYSAYNLEFFLGMATAFWLKNHSVSAPRLILFAGMTLFAITAVSENMKFIDGHASVSRLFYGVPAAMIVLGLAAAESADRIVVPKLLKTLGSASYSIYLFQFLFIAIAWKIWLGTGLDAAMPHSASFPILVGAALVGGVLASRWLEYPLMGLVRRSLSINRTAAAPA
jgi:exopolysaccharide production protein ExoZ